MTNPVNFKISSKYRSQGNYQDDPWGSQDPRQTQQKSALQFWFLHTMWLQPPSFSIVTLHLGHSYNNKTTQSKYTQNVQQLTGNSHSYSQLILVPALGHVDIYRTNATACHDSHFQSHYFELAPVNRNEMTNKIKWEYLCISSNPIRSFRIIITFLDPFLKQMTPDRIVPIFTTQETECMQASTCYGARFDTLNFDNVITVWRWTPS